MSRRVSALCCLLLLTCRAYSSPAVQEFFNTYSQEQAYLFTDHSAYLPGEVVWYKLYLWTATQEAQTSNFAYVLLSDFEGNSVFAQRKLLANGETHGDMVLPDTLASGIYLLSVYTSWMLNFSEIPLAQKAIWVSNGAAIPQEYGSRKGEEQLVVVEGGSLVADRTNRIGIFPTFFSPAGFTLKILDPDGVRVHEQKFTSFYAITEFRPGKAGIYVAQICSNTSGDCFEQRIQCVPRTALVFSEDTGQLKVDTHEALNGYLMILSESAALDSIRVEGRPPVEPVQLDLSRYPFGVLTAVLIDERGKIVSSRALYNFPRPQPEIGTVTNRYRSDGPLNYVDIEITHADRKSHRRASVYLLPEELATSFHFLHELDLSHSETVNDIMLFESFRILKPLQAYINGFPPRLKFSKEVYVSVGAGHLNDLPQRTPVLLSGLLLSGFQHPQKLDSVISFKQKLERIRTSYTIHNSYGYEKIAADKVYSTADYYTIESIPDFLDQAALNLIFRDKSGEYELKFMYTNTKGNKSRYKGGPVVLLDGKLISASDLSGLTKQTIKKIETLYDPRTIIDANLYSLFPFGLIALYTTEADVTPEPPDYFGALSHPRRHQFLPSTAGNSSIRIPYFATLYGWFPNLYSDGGRWKLSVVVPEAEQRLILNTLSLDALKKGHVFKSTMSFN